MTEQTATSIIVVSRERPEMLTRCLIGISQLYHSNFEIVVVADHVGRSAIEKLPLAGNIKIIAFEEANISAARNLGISHAKGELIAFIDDDAVPEPTWLCKLTQPFAQQDVAATGGFVIGRNGISFQWKAGVVDTIGRRTKIDVPEDEWSIPAAPATHSVKTEGTNCAFRQKTLSDLGGFDERFHYFLDETDLNMRCTAAGLKTAIAPDALVHHGFAASRIRTANRTPTDLREIGASSAVYHLKHHDSDQVSDARDIAHEEQQSRLSKMVKTGWLTRDEMNSLLVSFDRGYDEGERRNFGQRQSLTLTKDPFLRFTSGPENPGTKVLAGRIWSTRSLRREARRLIQQGHRVSLFLFSPTTAYHQVRFDPDGYWEQRGGLFGKSQRDGALFQLWSFRNRLQAEVSRIARQRGI